MTHGCDDIVMHHLQDHGKEPREQYLPLMELAHKEDPDDAQICFWLGREYMWANQPERGIELLQRYLALPSSTWAEERSEAMRYLARMQPTRRCSGWTRRGSKRRIGGRSGSIWPRNSTAKADWLNLFWACTNGIEKTRRTGSYLDDAIAGGSGYSIWARSPPGIST